MHWTIANLGKDTPVQQLKTLIDDVLLRSSNKTFAYTICKASCRDYSFIHIYSIVNGVHAGTVPAIMHNHIIRAA